MDPPIFRALQALERDRLYVVAHRTGGPRPTPRSPADVPAVSADRYPIAVRSASTGVVPSPNAKMAATSVATPRAPGHVCLPRGTGDQGDEAGDDDRRGDADDGVREQQADEGRGLSSVPHRTDYGARATLLDWLRIG
jgi:hypothetical protein